MARELFAQWIVARGSKLESLTRAFSRDWNDLLESARLESADQLSDAIHDAQALAAAGWVELKTKPYRPQEIQRISIPLAAEPRWREAFGFVLPSDEEARQIREFPWAPALAFLSTARLNLAFEELKRLNEFLAGPTDKAALVPIKERSLEIFGDEKRLDVLRGSALFRSGRLDLEAHLRCEVVGEPLGWKRGPKNTGEVLIIENAATWHSYARWNEQRALFSAVVYGRGLQAAQSVRSLRDILIELGGGQRLSYFGDIDIPGLQIPQMASAYGRGLGLPPFQPHLASYRWLLETGRDNAVAWEGDEPARREDCEWMGVLAGPVWAIIQNGNRLAQEHVGWTFLSGKSGWDGGMEGVDQC